MRGFRWVATGLEPPRDGPGATQTAHAGAHRGSRQPHEASRGAQRHPDAPGSDFEAILGRFWGPRDLEKPQEVLYCQRISWFSRFRKGAFNRGPRSSKRSPPGSPRSGPRADKTAPRGARSVPRGAQDHPGAPQERTQGAQAAQTPPGSPSGAHFGLILEPPGPHFRAS